MPSGFAFNAQRAVVRADCGQGEADEFRHPQTRRIKDFQQRDEAHAFRAAQFLRGDDEVRNFFFGEDLMLRRHDYNVNIAGGFAASQLTSQYAVANGIRLPTKRRAYTRGPDRRPILEMLMVSIDISEVSFT